MVSPGQHIASLRHWMGSRIRLRFSGTRDSRKVQSNIFYFLATTSTHFHKKMYAWKRNTPLS